MVLRCHTGTCVCPSNKNLSLNENCQSTSHSWVLQAVLELLEGQDLGVHSPYAVLSVTHSPRSFKEKNLQAQTGAAVEISLFAALLNVKWWIFNSSFWRPLHSPPESVFSILTQFWSAAHKKVSSSHGVHHNLVGYILSMCAFTLATKAAALVSSVLWGWPKGISQTNHISLKSSWFLHETQPSFLMANKNSVLDTEAALKPFVAHIQSCWLLSSELCLDPERDGISLHKRRASPWKQNLSQVCMRIKCGLQMFIHRRGL